MDKIYKEMIGKLLASITDERTLRLIYLFIKEKK